MKIKIKTCCIKFYLVSKLKAKCVYIVQRLALHINYQKILIKRKQEKNEFSLNHQFMSVFLKTRMKIWHEKIEIKHVNKTIL